MCEKTQILFKNLTNKLLFDVTKTKKKTIKRFFNTGKFNIDSGINDWVLKIKTIANKKSIHDVSTVNIPNKTTRGKQIEKIIWNRNINKHIVLRNWLLDNLSKTKNIQP